MGAIVASVVVIRTGFYIYLIAFGVTEVFGFGYAWLFTDYEVFVFALTTLRTWYTLGYIVIYLPFMQEFGVCCFQLGYLFLHFVALFCLVTSFCLSGSEEACGRCFKVLE